MSERNHAAVGTGMSTMKKWTLVIGGTAAVLVSAGVAIQLTRPVSAFPQDGAESQPAGRATTADPNAQGGRKVKTMARVANQSASAFITYEELAAECVQRHGEEILDNLINRKIIQQACDAQGIEVSEAEVEAEIIKNAKKFNLDVVEWQKMLQAERNVTPAQYRRDIIWPMLALKKLAGEEVKISKDDLKKAFERNYGPRVKARAIVLDNQRRAAEVWKKANDNPEEFERLAREHSVDPSSRSLGGTIPPIPRFSGSPDLEKAAFKLKEGEISAVIQVGPATNQFIILKCEGQTEPTVTSLKDVEDILRQELHEEKVQISVANIFKKLKDDARVDNYLTGKSEGGERRSAAAQAGKGPIRQTGAASTPRRTAKPIAEDAGDDGADEAPAPTPKRPAGKAPAAR
jgi:foldase protein PrsA